MTDARSRFALPEVQGRAAEDHMDVLRVGRAAALDVHRIAERDRHGWASDGGGGRRCSE